MKRPSILYVVEFYSPAFHAWWPLVGDAHLERLGAELHKNEHKLTYPDTRYRVATYERREAKEKS